MHDVFKVWVRVERVNHDDDVYEDVGEPVDVEDFETSAAAEDYAAALESVGDLVEAVKSAQLNLGDLMRHCEKEGNREQAAGAWRSLTEALKPFGDAS